MSVLPISGPSRSPPSPVCTNQYLLFTLGALLPVAPVNFSLFYFFKIYIVTDVRRQYVGNNGVNRFGHRDGYWFCFPGSDHSAMH